MNRSWKMVNRILTLLTVLILVFWCWKVFGPGGQEIRNRFIGTGFGLRQMFFMGVAVCCIGYLLWRGLAYYYEKKYGLDDDED
ncbi:MAG: hypothetical protein Q4E34_01225 [Synergistaceae bacterium]|nr:hypothetical protein [Synergistaceae bacterium]